MNLAQANIIRSNKISGKSRPNAEQRRSDVEAKIAEESKWAFDRLWDTYQTYNGEYSTYKTDLGNCLHLTEIKLLTLQVYSFFLGVVVIKDEIVNEN